MKSTSLARTRLAALGAGALVLGAVGVTSVAGASTEPADLPHISLGVAPALSAAPGMYALEQGYFEEFGVDVEISTEAAVSSEALPLLATGDYTVLAATWSAAMLNALQDGDVVNVLGDFLSLPDEGVGTTQILIAKDLYDEGQTTAAAFEGQRVGVLGLAGLAEFEMQQAIVAEGVAIEDVELVVLTRQDLQAAFENGSIAGSWCSEPTCTSLVNSGAAVSIGNPAGAGQDIFVLFSNSDFAAEHPEAMTGFVAAWLKASRELVDGAYDDPEVQAMIAEYTGLPVEVIASVPMPDFITEAARMAPEAEYVKAHEDYYRTGDNLNYDEPLDITTRFDQATLDGAAELLGDA